MTRVDVLSGDITQVNADGLITAINGAGMWFGGIDGAIQRSAGNMFHAQASAAMPLSDGQVLFAPALHSHNGRFGGVVFLVDNLERPLSELVLAGLQEAERQGLARISLPTLRTGVMAGVHETIDEALNEMAVAVREFVASDPVNVHVISFVVYNDSASERVLKRALRQLT
jgi:O-acetyl-ADP-ribose deacetylase (regulator of RNase III)